MKYFDMTVEKGEAMETGQEELIVPRISRRPTAYVPIAMSLAALAVVIGRIALFGTAPDPDEGTAAHLFQLLLVAQFPIIGAFALRWLPRAPAAALRVLVLQLLAALLALAPVFLFGF